MAFLMKKEEVVPLISLMFVVGVCFFINVLIFGFLIYLFLK